MKRQPSGWEKIIANEATDKGLISKYINSSYTSISEKQHNKKWAEDINRHFSKKKTYRLLINT